MVARRSYFYYYFAENFRNHLNIVVIKNLDTTATIDDKAESVNSKFTEYYTV